MFARYNVINKQIELLIPNAQFSIDNQANAALAHVLSWVNRFGMSTGNVQDFVTAIADSNQYNPVLQIGFYRKNGIKTAFNGFLGNN